MLFLSQVDHIIEIQMMKAAHTEATKNLRITRANNTAVKNLINSEPNLNVTTKDINRAKWPPFRKFLRNPDATDTVESYARQSCMALVDDGTWKNIEKSQTVSFDELRKGTEDLRDHAMKNFTEALLDEVHKQLESAGIF